MQLKACIPNQKPYPKELINVGDHIRKVRLDRNLSQIQVAKLVGCSEETANAWETGRHEPPVSFMPGIIQFLGYYPFGKSETLGQKLKEWRMRNGMSIKNLIKVIKMDGTTLQKIEADNLQVFKASREKVQKFIAS